MMASGHHANRQQQPTSNGHSKDPKTSANNNSHRNFRNVYYERVGLRLVEAEKALDAILHGPDGLQEKEKPYQIDLNKLANFTSRFPLPNLYRERVWMLLLGLMPPVATPDQFILSEQKKLCHDLQRCLYLLNLTVEEEDDDGGDDEDYNCSSRAKTLVLMYLLEADEEGLEPINCQTQEYKNPKEYFETSIGKRLLSMAQVFADTLTLPFEYDYWIFREFVRLNERLNLQDVIPKILSELLQEDAVLYSHLESLSNFSMNENGSTGSTPRSDSCSSGSSRHSHVSSSSSGSQPEDGYQFHPLIPFESWFSTCFSGLVSGCFLIKIWDRVISPPSALKILALMAKNFVILHRKEILAMKEASQVRSLLLKVSVMIGMKSSLTFNCLQPLPSGKSESLVVKVIDHAWEPV